MKIHLYNTSVKETIKKIVIDNGKTKCLGIAIRRNPILFKWIFHNLITWTHLSLLKLIGDHDHQSQEGKCMPSSITLMWRPNGHLAYADGKYFECMVADHLENHLTDEFGRVRQLKKGLKKQQLNLQVIADNTYTT
jgi:hypothetical protein